MDDFLQKYLGIPAIPNVSAVLANELAQRGINVVALEAVGRSLPDDYVNDEWDNFGQLTWTDPRTTSGDWRVAKDFTELPAWIVKAVGGTTIHWAGSIPSISTA